MKILIGTYRADKAMLDRCYDSMVTHLADTERWQAVFVDDSGDDVFRDWLALRGQVLVVGDGTGKQGFAKAMVAATDFMKADADEYFGWWEEDFVATKRIHLDQVRAEMDPRPNLAQVVFVRQPWFPEEITAGSMLEHLSERLGQEFEAVPTDGAQVDRLLMHDMIFSTNPGVWAPLAYHWGWPDVWNSEERKTRYLVDDDNACFGYWGDEVMVHHDGERTGVGY